MRRLLEYILAPFSWASGIIISTALFVLLGFLFMKGLGPLGPDLIFGHTPPTDALLFHSRVFDGLFPALAGTLILITGSMTVSVPVGVAAGIYMAEFAGSGPKAFLNLFFDILAAIPSIVIGLTGLSLTIFLHHIFPGKIALSMLISCLSLALLVLSYIIRSTQTALESIGPCVARYRSCPGSF